jgi:hypothetical protein
MPPRNKVDAYAAVPPSGAGPLLQQQQQQQQQHLLQEKTEEKELPGGDSDVEVDGSEENLLCILDVAYAPGEMDQIPVRVGDKASDLAAVRTVFCFLCIYL